MKVRVTIFLLISAVASTSTSDQRLRSASMRIYIEDSPAAEDLVEKAEDLRNRNRLVQAARTYQQAIDQYGEKLIRREDHLYTGAIRHIHQKIAADPELLALYRQLYEPLAHHALEQAIAEPAPQTALEKSFVEFRLCQSGQKAGLLLAGLLLEQGRLDQAIDVLEELPPQAQGGQYHLLHAVIGLFGGDTARIEHHRRWLIEQNEQEKLERLEAWASSTHQPENAPGRLGQEDLPLLSLPKSLGQPLWQRTLTTAKLGPKPNAVGRRTRMPFPAPMLEPVGVGEMLYVVVDGAVVALDRNSGQELWTYRAPGSTTGAAQKRRRIVTWPASGSICIVGERVVAIVGSAGTTPRTRYKSTLACIDRRTGRELWRAAPGDLDEQLAGAIFQGRPLPSGNRVYVSLRRPQQQMADAYVAAIDVDRGEVLWRRHVASSANASRSRFLPSRIALQMTLAGGRLYIWDPVGIALCVKKRRGSVLWLAQIQTNANPTARGRRAFDARPLLVEAGLVLPTGNRNSVPVLLDPDTGRRRRNLTGPGWRGARYYLAAGPNVIAVGPSVRLIDGKTLKTIAECKLPAASAAEIGRAVLTRDHLLVPIGSTVAVVDRRTFRINHAHAIEPGQILPLEGQLIVSNRHSLFSYMNWSQAYARLKEKTAANPLDPSPALALARISQTAGRSQQLLEGVDAALLALQHLEQSDAPDGRNQSVHQQVFSQVLWLIEHRKLDPALRAQLLTRLGSAARGPADTVAYHLTQGRHLEQANRPQEAFDHYQFILQDPELASQLYSWRRGSRRASLEAQLRQSSLLAKHSNLQARYEAFARHKLRSLIDDAHSTPDEFFQLSDQFPGSRVAADAAIKATQILTTDAEVYGAIRHLRRIYALSKAPTDASRIVGRLVELYTQVGQPGLAHHWLSMFRHRFPNVRPLHNHDPVDVSAWLAELEEAVDTVAALPQFELPVRGVSMFPGRLLLPVSQPPPTTRDDSRWLLRRTSSLQLCAGPHFETIWSVPVEANSQIELLAIMPQQIVLYKPQTAMLMSVETDTGRLLWADKSIEAILSDTAPLMGADRPVRRLRRIQPLAPKVPMRRQKSSSRPYFVLINDQTICLADRIGRAVGLDAITGKQMWRFTCDMESVHACQMSEDLLVLGGHVTGAAGAPARAGATEIGVLQGLDPVTGQQRFPKVHTDDRPAWLGFHHNGAIICATAKQILAFGPIHGQQVWSQPMPKKRQVMRGIIHRNSLLLEVRKTFARRNTGLWRIADLLTGTLTKPLPLPTKVFSAVAAEDAWHLASQEQAMMVNSKGHAVWRDAIFRRKHLVGQFVSSRYVALVDQDVAPRDLPGRPRAPGTPGLNHRLYLLDRHSGAIVDEYDLPVVPGPIDAANSALFDHQLLLAVPSGTLVIRDGSH